MLEETPDALRIPGLLEYTPVQRRYVAGVFRRRLLQADLMSLLRHVSIRPQRAHVRLRLGIGLANVQRRNAFDRRQRGRQSQQ